MAHITLNKANFFHNLDLIAKQTKDIQKIALVLKDNAYGHGLLKIAKLAKEYGIKKAVVRNSHEAELIQDYFEYILVLADTKTIENNKIRYTINNINDINKFEKNTKIELKIDTGMHRNGIAPHEIQTAFKLIKKQQLKLEAVFTHHRSADELTSEWFWQNKLFEDVKKDATKLALKYDFKQLRFHSANSASLFRHKNFNEDMARVGLAAYGCLDGNFKAVLSLYASKISTREIKKGEAIGYGATYTANDDMKVSNYDFGYGDGFLRSCSNKYVTPNNEQLLGRISMDNSTFLSTKDEILVFDDANQIAKSTQTISYEVLTSLKENIKRVIV